MSTNGKKGTVTWILAFLTFLAILNVFNAIIHLNSNSSMADLRIFNIALGSLNTEAYLWVSIIATFLLFGATSFSIYRGFPADPHMLQRLVKVEENLAFNANMIENTQIGFFRKLEENEKANDEFFRKITTSLEDVKKDASENSAKQQKAMQKIEEVNKKNAGTITKQTKELTNIKKKIENIAKETAQKAKLTSQTKLEKFKGVSPRLANKLNQIQIKTVSELLASDSASIAEKAFEPVETISRAQATAQLLMVPGVDEKHAQLLVKVGITSRRELANQDPVQLYRSIAGIARTYVEQGRMSARKAPTIEDVSSWIKQAQL